MLNRSGESGHPFLIPDLRRKAFSYLPSSMMLAVGLSLFVKINDLTFLRYVPSIPTLLGIVITNKW